LDPNAPIRSRAAEEGDIQIPLWSVPLVLVVLYVCLFSGLGAIGLVGPDEPRYASIARAMAETRDWVTPRLWGTPWFEKPVLYYWAAGAAMRLFGVSEFSARLPSALAALLAVFAATWTALRSYGLGAAWYTLLMLPTTVAMIGFARAAGPDMLFAALLTAAMAVAVEILQTPRPGTLSRVLFGFFLGAAVLAKGPAAIILAGGATLLWAAFSRQWRAPFQFLHPLVIAAFLVTALPWYALCALRNPDFLRVFLWQHNFERYLTPVFEHRQPFWFFGPILLLGLLPWVFFLFPIGVRLRQWHLGVDSPSLFFASWAMFPVLFFSFSQSKLPGYILPVIPPLLLLAARGIAGASNRVRGTPLLAMGITGFALVLFALLLLSFDVTFSLAWMKGEHEYAYLALTIAVAGLAVIVLSFSKRIKPAFLVIVAVLVALPAYANLKILPKLDSLRSARPVAHLLLDVDPSGEGVSVYQIPRAWHYGLNYYLRRELPDWSDASPRSAWLFGDPRLESDFVSRYGIRLKVVSNVEDSFVLLYEVPAKAENAPPR
jgi:4-amino-4-deoxy-L-arabinose transferase-like glycosyltransferase